MLRGVSVVSHQLSHCTIIESEAHGAATPAVTRREYRLHRYTIRQYRDPKQRGAGSAASASLSSVAGVVGGATTSIALAFPVSADRTPQRSAHGELVFAYLPVTAAGLPFALHADFELVASRQEVSDSNSANHVLLARVPKLFVHAVLTDPALGEDAFAAYLPDTEAVRRDNRSGGGRKWHTLALALHQETSAFMMVPTEDAPEKVRRKHATLRPPHLSARLVPNALLKARP